MSEDMRSEVIDVTIFVRYSLAGGRLTVLSRLLYPAFTIGLLDVSTCWPLGSASMCGHGLAKYTFGKLASQNVS